MHITHPACMHMLIDLLPSDNISCCMHAYNCLAAGPGQHAYVYYAFNKYVHTHARHQHHEISV
jgi:hypothetical protein